MVLAHQHWNGSDFELIKRGKNWNKCCPETHIRINRLPMDYRPSERSQLSSGSQHWYRYLESGGPGKMPWLHRVAIYGSLVPRPTDTALYKCPDPKAGVKIMRINNTIGCYSYVTASLLREHVFWIVSFPRRWTWPGSSTQFHLALMKNKCKYHFH